MKFEDVKTDKDLLRFSKGKWDTNNPFWIFVHLGNGDAFVCNALFRHYAELHKDRYVIIPCWERNLANIQWLLSDVPNIFFYPIETEQQMMTIKSGMSYDECIGLGFYYEGRAMIPRPPGSDFNPVKWDSEFYRQAGLDPELKWKGFKLPEFQKSKNELPIYIGTDGPIFSTLIMHDDPLRGFKIKDEYNLSNRNAWSLSKDMNLDFSCNLLYTATEIHCIDSSMLNLADLMETPYCKRFVFHRYARKGLPPTLKKNWEILD